MSKLDLKRKLTSRKLWAAVAGFLGPLLVAFGMDNDSATRVVSLVMAGASVIAYIIGEGLIDAAGQPVEPEAVFPFPSGDAPEETE